MKIGHGMIIMKQQKKNKRPKHTQHANTQPNSIIYTNNTAHNPSTTLVTLTCKTHCNNNTQVTDASITWYNNILAQIIYDFNLEHNILQLACVKIVCEHMINKDSNQLLFHISGVGGTGKSHVIHAIRQFFNYCNMSNKIS